MSKVSVRLKDGRIFDFETDTMRSPGDMVDSLKAAGVRLEDIEQTIHYIPAGVFPPKPEKQDS